MYRINFGTKCLRLFFRNFLTKEMHFRRPRDVAKRTQLSGMQYYVCVWFVCDSVCVCVLFMLLIMVAGGMAQFIAAICELPGTLQTS